MPLRLHRHRVTKEHSRFLVQCIRFQQRYEPYLPRVLIKITQKDLVVSSTDLLVLFGDNNGSILGGFFEIMLFEKFDSNFRKSMFYPKKVTCQKGFLLLNLCILLLHSHRHSFGIEQVCVLTFSEFRKIFEKEEI
jgi:hypothetical protein